MKCYNDNCNNERAGKSHLCEECKKKEYREELRIIHEMRQITQPTSLPLENKTMNKQTYGKCEICNEMKKISHVFDAVQTDDLIWSCEECQEKGAALVKNFDPFAYEVESEFAHDYSAKTSNELYVICSKCERYEINGPRSVTDCPGRPLTDEEDYRVYLGELDFIKGEWVETEKNWVLVASISTGKKELRWVEEQHWAGDGQSMFPAKELIHQDSPVFTKVSDAQQWIQDNFPQFHP